MKSKTHSPKYLKQRKFLMMLPLLTLPSITLLFWALGGGSSNELKAGSNTPAGLNLKLPDAKFKDDKELDKLSFYRQAALDSVKAREAEKIDPYWNNPLGYADSNNNPRQYSDYSMDANKTKVYSKLDELKQAMDKSRETSYHNSQSSNRGYSLKSYASSNDLVRLQAMMQKMKEDKAEDPEITQLNDMLDKIMAIQNPVQIKTADKSPSDKTFSMKPRKHDADISLLAFGNPTTNTTDTIIEAGTGNAFYSQSDFYDEHSSGNSIQAIISETQTIVAGATVKLALMNDVTISGVILPSGTLIYGTAAVSDERLKIAISSIRYENSILPVSLNVYDIDGQEGIYVPGSINRSVAKQSATNAISDLSIASIDQSIGAQAASAGIDAAKSLFSKKVKLIKMTIRSGYKVFLKDNHEN